MLNGGNGLPRIQKEEWLRRLAKKGRRHVDAQRSRYRVEEPERVGETPRKGTRQESGARVSLCRV